MPLSDLPEGSPQSRCAAAGNPKKRVKEMSTPATVNHPPTGTSPHRETGRCWILNGYQTAHGNESQNLPGMQGNLSPPHLGLDLEHHTPKRQLFKGSQAVSDPAAGMQGSRAGGSTRGSPGFPQGPPLALARHAAPCSPARSEPEIRTASKRSHETTVTGLARSGGTPYRGPSRRESHRRWCTEAGARPLLS